jgi:hypothetical protein
MSNIQIKNRGYSLPEMLIYVGIICIISLVVVRMLVAFGGSYRVVVASRRVDYAAMNSLERMSRDIRASTSVNSATSVFGTSPGVLTLLSTINGLSTTTKYYIQDGILKLDVNGVYVGPLTSSNVLVTNLTFQLLDNGTSRAIKMNMTLQGVVGASTKSKTYHSTIVLKAPQ